ncbi:hypothetical protein ACP4OV_018906 [Aristida adscensionis]
MASPAPPTAKRQVRSPLPALIDELLEEIFLRLPTPTDLACASTACRSFCRIITEPSFLRRFRALHPPPLLGFVRGGLHAAQPLHPSAPLARALADAADFSYAFIPRTDWWPSNVRQGRVLLRRYPFELCFLGDVVFPELLELAVCDPLYRRYVLLPPIPRELLSEHEPFVDFGLFLAPTGSHDDKEENCSG